MSWLRQIVEVICSEETHGTTDHKQLEEALYLSLLGAGGVSPNPMVAAIIVKGGESVGFGIHRNFGKEHAEALAIQQARDSAKDADVYVNLEPCDHYGNQPPCTKALIEAQVKTTIFGGLDPNPLTFNRAVTTLSKAGVEVKGPLMPIASARLNDAYYFNQVSGRPFVCLKLALSLDGKLALSNRDSMWISGKISRGYAHFLRLAYDAVIVGIGTVATDNPRLTVRRPILQAFVGEDIDRMRIRNPARVILDPDFTLLEKFDLNEEIERGFAIARNSNEPDLGSGNTRPPLDKMVKPPLNILVKVPPVREGIPWLIIAGREEKARGISGLPEGVEILPLSGNKREIAFEDLWKKLASFGVFSMLVEGGAGLAKRLISQRALTRLDAVIAPLVLGEDGLGFSPALQFVRIEDAMKLHYPISLKLGRDTLICGYTSDWLTPIMKKGKC